ncbi:hypothetical protein EGC76_03500 [Pseudidiomarina gelatinasegens]|mgnify:CR=1 FL=1|uniref:Uncharacterized protein n=1 Tax=Pseudidiomarina gelatinasegens TaxID=2487740 RepID=A0A443Z668_9GAMM|nr:hypothetical protein [Pseudidiomarina gelatinasegens]RWU12267.1 hypothetical protein EGC76_03500 [Pseudidiomarina gelatinasegens]
MTQQGDIFQQLTPTTTVGVGSGAFAELCTALYERELKQLAQQEQISISLLQRRLQSVPYYVQNAARGMLESDAPYTLDVQNASWQTPQKKHLTVSSTQASKLQRWLSRSARLGDTVPIFDLQSAIQQVRLDSIDRIDKAQHRVHCNMHGWFNFEGKCLETGSDQLWLLRPDATNLAPAFCGHQWSHKGRIDPRTLTLREVLLATTVDF